MLSADWTKKEDNGTTKLVLYGFYYKLTLFSDFDFLLTDPVHGDQFEQIDRRYVTGGQLTQTFNQEWWGKKVTNTIGGQIRNDYIPDSGLNHTEDRQLVDVEVRDKVEEFSTGVFFNNEIQWTDWFRSNLGARGDFYAIDVDSEQFGNTGNKVSGIFSPKLSLIFGPWDKTEFYANVGTGFHSNDARGATINFNSSGLPQGKVPLLVRTKGAEIGARTSIVPGLVSTLSLWYLKSDSELTFDGDSGDTEANGASKRYGVEWANFYKPPSIPWLTLDADLALTHARYTDSTTTVTGSQGEYIANSIPITFSTGATVESPWGAYASLRLRYFGSQPIIEDNTVRQPASTIVEAKIGYRHDNYDIALEFLNLLDSHADDIAYYYPSRLPGEPAAGVFDTHVHPAEPFEVRASFTLRF
jgi:outer membrane receptor for Fe3+-dicitrate